MEDGARIIKIYKEYMSKTCILDDFEFYETRQKMIRDKKIKQKKQAEAHTLLFKPFNINLMMLLILFVFVLSRSLMEIQ